MIYVIDPSSNVFWVSAAAFLGTYFIACKNNRWELYLISALLLIIYSAQIWQVAFSLALLCMVLGITSLVRTIWAFVGRVPRDRDKSK